MSALAFAPVLDECKAHAAKDFPRESCGVVAIIKGRYRYVACQNIATGNEHFTIDPGDWAAAEDAGEVVGVVHSHPYTSPQPSQADRVACEASGVPWLIINHPVGHTHVLEPSGYEAPLVGRAFSHGILDCYTIIRDYYQRELGINLENYRREDDWWLTDDQDLYMANLENAGFVCRDQQAEPQMHDMILMQIAAPKTNHAGIYLGNGHILHHLYDRLSSRDVYGGWLQKCTTEIVYHKKVPQ